MAVQGATNADQRGPDASQPPAPDGAVATVAPQERGLEMQPEEKVTHARTRARADSRAAHSRTRAQTHGWIYTARAPSTPSYAHSHTRTDADTHVRAYT